MQRETRAFVVMDTPYRFQKTLGEIHKYFSDRQVLLTINLTAPDEMILEGTTTSILGKTLPAKAEFLALVYAKK